MDSRNQDEAVVAVRKLNVGRYDVGDTQLGLRTHSTPAWQAVTWALAQGGSRHLKC